MKIVVAGGTGLIGRMVVEAAEEQGHQVVVLARSRGTDLVTGTGTGLTERLTGADALIDVVNTTTTSARKSTDFFTTTTRNLLAAAESAGVRHHLTLSIVGVDRAPVGYYAGKRAQEQVVEAAATPWTILRATQFHEFVPQVYGLLRIGPLHLAPKMRLQPVAAREVAARLVALAVAEPARAILELGGPREEDLPALIRSFARSVGAKGWLPAVAIPGAFGRAQRDGTVLPGPGAERGTQTFEGWLQER